MSEPDGPDEPTTKQDVPAPEEAPFAGLLRAFKRFLIPFLLSWVLAYVGSNLQLEWLYFTGLTGVGVSMLGLMVWLIS
jgi:hypothetical protein